MKTYAATLFFGVITASLMTYLGLSHNAMGEFCRNPGEVACDIDWVMVLGLWMFWMCVVSGGLGLLVFVFKTFKRTGQ
ncbi:hypothetical protein HCH_03734 [Hahella chejuensis KCTC 2396]|uniref:Uncharacterized protein n=1 Tax=Hahella chejuensis (strain KCTC 2396) TaxID=349521 RepID=Q2SFV6_HAHCH|nr:hypothetical protein [Hahella chejuensis]ABC30468.1 hypothetical protein HCH_03734 [Hahella chejuensis KCTC 2396]